MTIFRLRLRSLLSRDRVEQELEEELRYHLDRQIAEELAAGKAGDEARHAAMRAMKDLAQREEECRDTRGLNMVDNTARDLRFAFRQLRKNPGFACAAIFVLALGISAALTIFGFADAALIRPLPYRDQGRLVATFESDVGYARSMTSYLNFSDWRRFNHAFSGLDAFALNGSFTLTTRTGAEQVPGTRVSAGFFRTLGVRPILGRDFRPEEESVSAPRTVLLTYDAWQKRFGGKPDVLGKVITLNGNPTTIIGVLPRDFQFAPYGGAQFWGNLRGSDGCEQQRTCRNLFTVARLKDGVSIKTASAEMQSVVRQIRDEYPDDNRGVLGANLVPLREFIIGDIRPVLLALLTGAGLLLLIACINVTALLLARSETRQREIAVRGALGASFSRLARQFAIEGLVLALFGGVLAALFAGGSMRLAMILIPPEKLDRMPYFKGLGLHLLTIALACLISLLAAVLFATIPIGRISLSQMIEGLKAGGRGSAGIAWRRFGANLVVIELAIAMVLMVGAGLLGKSFYLLLHVDVGFRPDHLATLQTSWAPGRYKTDPEEIALARTLLERISRIPGVKSVALSLAPPVDSDWATASFHIVGRPNHGENNEVLNRQVTPAYFTTLQARLMRGRYFSQEDGASKPLVAIINRTLANKYFSGEDPVGKQIYYDWRPRAPMQIGGVVDDIKEGPLEGANLPALYVPYDQNPAAWPAVLVRTSQNESPVLPEIARAIHQIDPFITVSEGQTITERINNSPAAYLHRSAAWLMGGFAGIAFVLCVVGLYGVVAYSVSQRTREIGIRMALGAERSTVHQLILKEAGRITALGLVFGVVCSLGAGALLRALLFGVHSWDVTMFSIVAVTLGLSALLASYIPAHRAASVNPVEALRTE